MKSTKYTSHNEFKWEQPVFDKVAWLNTQAIDYKLLKNKP